MSAPVTPSPSTSRLDRILLHLGVQSQKIDELRDAFKEQARTVHSLELARAASDSSSKSSTSTWLFVWQAVNTVLGLTFAAVTLWRAH